jgi:L-malate glycosyltransferase
MASKIKVLHIIKSLGRGGAEMLLPETLALHDNEKFEFHYIYFLPWKDQMVAAIQKHGGKVTCFKANNNIQIILQWREVRKYITENNISLIHAHLPWAGFLSRILFRLARIPVVYTEHNKQERYHKLTFLLNKLTFNWQTRAIAVSGDVAESININIKPKIAIQCILNGVNTASFCRDPKAGEQIRRDHNIPTDAFVIGTVAVFRFQKRLVEWLEVMAEVCNKDKRIYGIIVGDGPLKAEIVTKRKELGLEERVVMPGLITEVKPWLSAINVYMMTSVFEGLPIALLEAMSMECAVVATNAGGIKEVIRNEQDGLTVDVDEWRKLPGLIDRIKDRNMLLALSRSARLRVVESFSLKRMVTELETVYQSARLLKRD